jgi:hypothetical protein
VEPRKEEEQEEEEVRRNIGPMWTESEFAACSVNHKKTHIIGIF